MTRLVYVLPAAFLLALPVSVRSAEKLQSAVSIADRSLSRGDTIRIEIKDGQPVKSAQIILERNGREETLNATYEPAAGGRQAVTTALVNDGAKFGNYSVRAVLDGRKLAAPSITIGPPGRAGVTLAEFDPPDTYEVEPFLVPAAKPGEEPRTIRTVRLVLRGKGFVESPSEENVVWINQVRQDGIKWDHACSDPNFTAQAEAHAIHGELRSPEEMHLCFVPVPANGRLLVAAGFGDTAGEPRLFRVFNTGRARVGSISTAFALLLALVPLVLLRFVPRTERIGGRRYRLRMLFLDLETRTYSLSKLQFYLWTVAALFSYIYLFISRVHVQSANWPDVPASLPGVIVVAAGTAVGAQMVTAAKGPKGAGEEHPSLADFITSGGVVAPDRLQMLLWTILGVLLFFDSVLQLAPGTITEVTFPAVPERLLVLMGISSAGYLGGKMARKPGPVINEIAITPPESNRTLREQKAPAAAPPDLGGAVLQAEVELAKLTAGANADANAAIGALKSAIEATKVAHTVAEFNHLIVDLPKHRSDAEAAAKRAADALVDSKAEPAHAQTAQSAAAALQELTGGVMEAISAAAAPPIASEEKPPPPISRKIELRGSNLSPDAMLRIDDADLPFKMLFNSEGKELPDIVARDEVNPTFARALKLTIETARLEGVYRDQIEKWFGKDRPSPDEPSPHRFTLLNPDGQRAEISFSVPPATAQKVGGPS